MQLCTNFNHYDLLYMIYLLYTYNFKIFEYSMSSESDYDSEKEAQAEAEETDEDRLFKLLKLYGPKTPNRWYIIYRHYNRMEEREKQEEEMQKNKNDTVDVKGYTGQMVKRREKLG